MKRKIFTSAILVFALLSMSFAIVSADAHEAMVYVGHGIPGKALGLDDNALPVDVLVNDAICLLEGFEFGEFAGPVPLAPDTYNIKISLADVDNPCSGDPVIEADVPFEGGVNYTVFAHLTEVSSPTASVYVNDLSDVVSGHTRLTVRHTAAAPAVDIKVARGWGRGRMIGFIEGLANPDEEGPFDIRPGHNAVTIYPTGGDEAVLGPAKFVLNPHKAYFVYAVGGLDPETFTLLPHVIEIGNVPPPRSNPPG